MFYLTTHSTHFISGFMALDLWLKTTQREGKLVATPWATLSDSQEIYMHHATDRSTGWNEK